jgi:hypothetical protein
MEDPVRLGRSGVVCMTKTVHFLSREKKTEPKESARVPRTYILFLKMDDEQPIEIGKFQLTI